jgi:hypothetical protein
MMAGVHYDKEFCKLIAMILLVPILALYFVWNAMEEKEWQRRAKSRERQIHDSRTWPDILESSAAKKTDQPAQEVKALRVVNERKYMTRQMTRQASLMTIHHPLK